MSDQSSQEKSRSFGPPGQERGDSLARLFLDDQDLAGFRDVLDRESAGRLSQDPDPAAPRRRAERPLDCPGRRP